MAVIVIIYISVGFILYFIQDMLLFHPKAVSRDHHYNFPHPYQEMNIPFQEQNLSIIKFYPEEQAKGCVLFYHGNMHNVEHYARYPSVFLKNGYAVWMIDYPGFGKTTGKRTEAIINEQALLMYDLALKEFKQAEKITIYGKSIGTGIASYVASQKTNRQLVLETPYYSMTKLAKNYFPVYPAKALIRYKFPSNIYLRNIQSPVTLLHGTEDEIIPFRQAKKLKEEIPRLSLIAIENGKHNNLLNIPFFRDKLDSLLTN